MKKKQQKPQNKIKVFNINTHLHFVQTVHNDGKQNDCYVSDNTIMPKGFTISTVTKDLDNVVRLKNQQKLQQLTSTTALATPLFSTKLIL